MSAVVYGLTPTVAAIGYEGGVPPAALVFLRSLLGGVLLLGLAAATNRIRISLRDAAILAFLCGPLFAAQLLCFFAAINLTGAQIAVVLAHVSPVFVLIASAVVLRRRPGAASWTVCSLMLVGAALVAGAGGGEVVIPGVLLALVCAAAYAAYYLVGEPCLRRVSVVTATGLTSIGSALTAGLVVLASSPRWDFTAGGWTSVAIQGVVMVPLGIGGAYLAVRALGPVSGSMLGLLEPVVGVLAALVFLGESLALVQWFGVAVVLAASALLPFARVDRPSSVQPAGR